MEGVETNYKNIECLDTLKAFDEYELPYWHEVRHGATHTSVGAAEVISSICSRMPQDGVYKDINATSGLILETLLEAIKDP
jgi:hypothetical protein